jgi:hypothetical protein
MQRRSLFIAILVCAAVYCLADAAEKINYPQPRFPSYLKPPKSVEEVMPFARAAVRQTDGRTPLGLVEKGTATAIFSEPAAEDMVLQGIENFYPPIKKAVGVRQ